MQRIIEWCTISESASEASYSLHHSLVASPRKGSNLRIFRRNGFFFLTCSGAATARAQRLAVLRLNARLDYFQFELNSWASSANSQEIQTPKKKVINVSLFFLNENRDNFPEEKQILAFRKYFFLC